ncbi:MAG: hypothetical protein CSB33_04175 [Desulfobacterales bacterium]|nr:MAG: hypothetical protein CSB33_04175 [Desulfobacterales bacterium]
MAQLARIQPVKKGAVAAPQTMADRIVEVLEKGMQTPWGGIRPDIRMHKSGLNMQGEQTYVLEDPVSGNHFEIGDAEARFFLCLATQTELKPAIHKLLSTTSLRPSVEDILMFLRMLQTNQLAVTPDGAGEEMARRMEEMKANNPMTARWSDLTVMQKWRKIFFLRLPLLRPDPFLCKVMPWVSFLWSRPFLFLYAVLSGVGLVLVGQQMELFLHTATHIYTPKGAMYFALALVGVKVLHEFGHAFATRHYGLYVRRMGIYFFCFMPMLYTDATEAWKLAERKPRLMIGAAGMLTELVLAGLALFFWAVLPDGVARSIAFFVAGASLVSTFIANLNPLMRFDGYYLIMDYMRINSLRTRSIMMFKYHLRRLLVDWKGGKPEEHPWEKGLVVFGFFTSIYLVIITFSVWAIVWSLFPNLWTLIGMSVGAAIFFLGPVVKEAGELIKGRRNWGRPWRLALTLSVIAACISLTFVPIPETERLPALVLRENIAQIHAPGKGRLTGDLPEVGTRVSKNDVLVHVEDLFLNQNIQEVKADIAQLQATLANTLAGGAQGGFRKWLLAEKQRLTVQLEKLREEREMLTVRSPMDGVVLDAEPALEAGSYVYHRAPLLTVGSGNQREIRAYLHEQLYHRVRHKDIKETKVVFQDLETATTSARFKELLPFPVLAFPNEVLFDFAGGPILSSMTHLGAGGGGNPRQKAENPTVSPDMTLHLGQGVTAKEAWFPLIFSVADLPAYVRHGSACSVEVKTGEKSVKDGVLEYIWATLAKMGVWDVRREGVES